MTNRGSILADAEFTTGRGVAKASDAVAVAFDDRVAPLEPLAVARHKARLFHLVDRPWDYPNVGVAGRSPRVTQLKVVKPPTRLPRRRQPPEPPATLLTSRSMANSASDVAYRPVSNRCLVDPYQIEELALRMGQQTTSIIGPPSRWVS
jgi:hypothetical protein